MSPGNLINSLLEKLGETLSRITANLEGQGGKLLGIANSVGGGLGTMAGALTDLVIPGLGSLATTVIELPGKMLAAVTPFVEALNPALLLAFNQQLANLQATVGTAFENVFAILAPVLDTVASLLQSLMDQLRPVIDSVVQWFGGFLIEIVKNAVMTFKAMMPVIELLLNVFRILMDLFLLPITILRPLFEVLGFILKLLLGPINFAMALFAKAMEGLNTIFNIFDTVISTIIQTVQELIDTFIEGLGLGSIFDMLNDVLKQTISILLQLIAFAAKFLGADKFLDNLIKNLDKAGHAIAAPKDVGFKGIEQLTKDLAVSAFTAGAGTAPKTEDLLADAIKEMKEIREGNKTFQEFLNKWFTDGLAVKIKEAAKEAVDSWSKDHPVESGALSVGNWIRQLTLGF